MPAAGNVRIQAVTMLRAIPQRTADATRTIERHAAVHALLDAGRSLSAVGRELHLDLHTVRRFARAAEAEDLLGKARLRRDSVLDEFKTYLHQRWTEGLTNAEALTQEIAALGYRGSDKTVRRYLRPLRAAGAPAPSPVPLPPTARQVTGWLTRRPQDLPDTDTAVLQAITARCPALAGHLRPGPRVRQDAHPAARRTARELDGPRRGRGRTRTTRVHGQPAP